MLRPESLDLQFLEVLDQRAALTGLEKNQLQRSVRGYQGELQLDQLVATFFGHADLVCDDLTLQFKDELAQIDKLVLVGNTVYLLDAKNYRGSYTFKQNSWYSGQRLLATNIFRQIDRACDLLQQIFQAEGLQLTVQRVLLFMDPRVKLDIQQQAVQQVLRYSEIPNWLTKLKREAEIYPAIGLASYRRALAKYAAPAYRPEQDFAARADQTLRPGICCPHCCHFDWSFDRYTVSCRRCGFCQSKELAYVSTICDYGVLYFKHNLKRKELLRFLGEGGKEKYLRKQLKKHFEQLGSSKSHAGYKNYGLRFKYWFVGQEEYFAKTERRCKWKN